MSARERLLAAGPEGFAAAVNGDDLDLIDAAIELSREALGHPALPADAQVSILNNLGQALHRRYALTHADADWEACAEVLEQTLAAAPPGDVDRARAGLTLGRELLGRVRQSADPAGLERAIRALDAGLDGVPADGPLRTELLYWLALGHGARFDMTQAADDLDRVIAADGALLPLIPPGDEVGRWFPFVAGLHLRLRYDRTHDPADLDATIGDFRAGLSAQGPAATPSDLTLLAMQLTDRFDSRPTPADLDEAIAVLDLALTATPPADPDRAMRLAALGRLLASRSALPGHAADRDRAVGVLDQCLKQMAPGQEGRLEALTNLGVVLVRRFEANNGISDLDRAIGLLGEAISATAEADPNRAGRLGNLASAYQTRAVALGSERDLDDAVAAGRLAVAAAPPGHPARGQCETNLANALQARFRSSSATGDLEEAVGAADAAVRATAAEHPDRATVLANHGGTLLTRFERTGAVADLDAAIGCFTEALGAARPDTPDRYMYLTNLNIAHRQRFGLTGGARDLDEAISTGEQALALTEPAPPAGVSSNLALALQEHAAQTGSLPELERAIGLLAAAVQATPADHPQRGWYLSNLGRAQLQRYELGSPGHLAQAIDSYRAVLISPGVAPSVRALAGRSLGEAAARAGDWATAVAGYGAAVDALARVAPRSLARGDQEYWLAGLAGLATDAAACCLQLEDPSRAVELWEEGRGVLQSHALDSRTDLTDLQSAHPELAAAFIAARDSLDSPSASAPLDVDSQRRMAARFDEAVARIRALPGFERFLQPARFEQLLGAAAGGPVVLVNVSRIRSDALVLGPGGVDVVPLPSLRPEAVRGQVEAFLDALERARDPRGDDTTRDDAEGELAATLAWLWDAVAGPVLDKFAAGGPVQPVWWCPSGLLALLPLHAAGRHDTRFEDAPSTVIDRVVSSYTPTVRALLYARRVRAPLPGQDEPAAARILAVEMAQTPDAPDLPGAAEEIATLERLFGSVTDVLSGPAATHAAVLAALPSHSWVHFACHAQSDAEHPSQSRLVLHDHRESPLTVVDIARERLDDAELAFLSACATARTGAGLPDEAIQLAAAFQLAGYRHVIATLWPIGDEVALGLATDVYKKLEAAPVDAAALVLHDAVRRARALDATRPSTWAAHLHSGA